MLQRIFNRSIEDYLSKTDDPKLLLCCGHLRNCSDFYNVREDDGCDLRGQFMHGHQNWYTVDKDPGRYPDLIADLQDPEVLTYLSEILHDCLKIVYVEGWSFHSVKFHEMAYKTLKKGGILLYSLGQNKTPGHIMELKDTLMKAGFDLNKLYFFHNPFTEISKYGLRRTLMHYPTELWAWSWNYCGQFGVGDEAKRTLPTEIIHLF